MSDANYDETPHGTCVFGGFLYPNSSIQSR